jgi:putative transposase
MWNTLPGRFPGLELDQYVVMPNHFHGIVVLTEESRRHLYARGRHKRPPTLGDVIGVFKRVTSYNMHRSGAPSFAWQQDFFDHIIRNTPQLERSRFYIVTNPARWAEDELRSEQWGVIDGRATRAAKARPYRDLSYRE